MAYLGQSLVRSPDEEEFLADLHIVERALTTINRNVVKCNQLLDYLTPHGSKQWDRYASVVQRLRLAGRDIAGLGTALAKIGGTARDTDTTERLDESSPPPTTVRSAPDPRGARTKSTAAK